MLTRLKQLLFSTPWWNRTGKNRRELAYWEDNARRMVEWYHGRTPFRLPFPTDSERETRFDERTNAILTYIAAETRLATYLSDLQLAADSFAGQRLADIGSGPLPTLLVFRDCERICIDHLMDNYVELGYPLQHFADEIRFVHAKSESLPLADGSLDAVVSRNALDHVDNFRAACAEICRVLRPGGTVHLLLNYHPPTSTETQALDDRLVADCFPPQIELRPVRREPDAWGFDGGETVLWSNLPPHVLVGAEEEAAAASV